jgi:hypothetical protein
MLETFLRLGRRNNLLQIIPTRLLVNNVEHRFRTIVSVSNGPTRIEINPTYLNHPASGVPTVL